MPTLDLPSFVKAMQRHLTGYDKQESAFRLITGTINEQSCVIENGYQDNLSPTQITRIMQGKSPAPDGMRQASALPEVIENTIMGFADKVYPAINPHTRADVIDAVLKLVDGDETISEQKRNELKQVLDDDGESAFLAQAFLYALNRTFTKANDAVDVNDITLLAEANYRCPLCQNPLTETVKGIPVKRYKITRIFPGNLDSWRSAEFHAISPPPRKLDSTDNFIALCDQCSEQYLIDSTPEEYGQLTQLKKGLVRNYKASSELGNLALEDEIRTVVSALGNIVDGGALTKLSYDALHVAEKLGHVDYILLAEIQTHVVFYYQYIQKLFSDSGADFQLVCSEVKTASKKLENAGLSKMEVINRLSEWFMSHAALGEDSKQACDIVVAFFIQDCEVFSE